MKKLKLIELKKKIIKLKECVLYFDLSNNIESY